MAIKEGYIEVTGGKIWYQIHNGEMEETPVIILHGGPGSSHYAMQGLSKLAMDRPVIFYDQLGCGKSERPSDTSLWKLERFVQELAQIKEALGLTEFHILGHSWGTTLAAAYYLTKPDGIKSIIFSSPCLSAPLWAKDQMENRKRLPKEVQETLTRCEENGTTDSKEYKEATGVFNRHFVCRLESAPEFLKDGARYKNPDVYQTMWGPTEFYVTGNLKEFDCTSQLKEITIPTLFTCGHYDEATPKTTEYYHSLTPNASFHVFKHSSHMPYLEEEREYMKVVRQFLFKVDHDK